MKNVVAYFLLIKSVPQYLSIISIEKKIQIFPVKIVQVNVFFFTSTRKID